MLELSVNSLCLVILVLLYMYLYHLYLQTLLYDWTMWTLMERNQGYLILAIVYWKILYNAPACNRQLIMQSNACTIITFFSTSTNFKGQRVSIFDTKPFNLTTCFITKRDAKCKITHIKRVGHGQQCMIIYKLCLFLFAYVCLARRISYVEA